MPEMKQQAEMFDDKPPGKQRRSRRRIAHAVDNGNFPDGRMCALFRCRCGWESGWVGVRNQSDAELGIPCEPCNEGIIG